MKLNERYAIVSRKLEDGRFLDLFPLTLGRVRITLSLTEDDLTWVEGW